MHSIFEVSTPVESNALLTTAEAKTALGITGSTRDADVTRAVARISAAVFRACNVRSDGVHAPSLLAEGITETFRLECPVKGALLLSRRRVSEIATLTEAGSELTEDTDFTVDPASGQLFRLGSGDDFACWPRGKIVVAYTAGFGDVPDDLKLAAETWLRVLWRDSYDDPASIPDPMLKREEIVGIRTIERWVDPTKTDIVPPEVMDVLLDGGYVETWIA